MKLPTSVSQPVRPLVVSVVLSLAALAIFAGSARPATTVASGGGPANCHPGWGGHDGICIDPVGDVKGVAGPDITRVEELEWGVIFFQVTFAKTGGARSPLAHTAGYTDEVSVTLTAQGAKATKRYRLTLFATDLAHLSLQRLPATEAPIMLHRYAGAGTGKWVTLGVDLRPYVGYVNWVRYRVEAARVMRNGMVASSDYVPDKGTTIWTNGSRSAERSLAATPITGVVPPTGTVGGPGYGY